MPVPYLAPDSECLVFEYLSASPKPSCSLKNKIWCQPRETRCSEAWQKNIPGTNFERRMAFSRKNLFPNATSLIKLSLFSLSGLNILESWKTLLAKADRQEGENTKGRSMKMKQKQLTWISNFQIPLFDSLHISQPHPSHRLLSFYGHRIDSGWLASRVYLSPREQVSLETVCHTIQVWGESFELIGLWSWCNQIQLSHQFPD